MNWYTVVIRGYYDNKPLEVRETVQAADAEDAVFATLHCGVDVRWGEDAYGQRVIVFDWAFGFDEAFVTEHASLDEMVSDVVDAAAIARLTGHPMLPLEVE